MFTLTWVDFYTSNFTCTWVKFQQILHDYNILVFLLPQKKTDFRYCCLTMEHLYFERHLMFLHRLDLL